MEEDKKKLIRLIAISSSGCLLPFCLIGFTLIAGVLILMGLLEGGGGSGSTCVNIKGANEICKSITVAGHGTMTVDEYVAGVVQHEFAGASPETLKAQAIAARSYGLAGAEKDPSGNCYVGDTSEGFQTYSPNPSASSINAANETSGMIMVNEAGDVMSTEYSSNSLPNAYSTYGNMVTMSERNLEIPKDWWTSHKTCSDSALNTITSKKDAYGRPVYGCGHGRGMGQIAAWYLDLEKGYNYTQILDFFYGAESEYNWSLASTKGSTSHCTSSNNGNLTTLKNYNLGRNGLTKLDRTLTEKETDDLNDYINKEVKKAGYGTGAGVAAAGQALVYWLEQKGYYLQYWYGGGQCCGDGNSTFVGVNPNWGSTAFGADSHGNGDYFGMDCSGFASWAVRTACAPNSGSRTAVEWQPYGEWKSSLKDAKPGDMLSSSGHVQLVVKNNGDGTVIVAEEGGGNGGLAFSLISSTSAKIVDMTNWYKTNCD